MLGRKKKQLKKKTKKESKEGSLLAKSANTRLALLLGSIASVNKTRDIYWAIFCEPDTVPSF